MPSNRTGCPYLDSKGIIQSMSGVHITLDDVDIKSKEVVNYCLECPLEDECILVKQDRLQPTGGRPRSGAGKKKDGE